tara:strand:+ start:866 stop:1027 length:162 start_codon:yes stop_codon:yes gene_type:complete
MVIKKVLNLMSEGKKKPLNDKPLAINRIKAKSNLAGRKKVIVLKKIGKSKREG